MHKKSALIPLYHALAVVGLLATWYYNGQYILGGGGLAPAEFFGSAFANVLTTPSYGDAIWTNVSEENRLTIHS
jgi:hypothetical protein